MNWIVAAGYGLAGLACFARGLQRGEAAWVVAAAALCCLALTQAAHLDLLITSVLRSHAWHEGWYGLRRPAQAIAIAAGAVALIIATRRLSSQPLLAAGVGICLFLGWARVVSYHHVDAILDARMSGLSAGRWIDAGGLVLVMTACLWPGVNRA